MEKYKKHLLYYYLLCTLITLPCIALPVAVWFITTDLLRTWIAIALAVLVLMTAVRHTIMRFLYGPLLRDLDTDTFCRIVCSKAIFMPAAAHTMAAYYSGNYEEVLALSVTATQSKNSRVARNAYKQMMLVFLELEDTEHLAAIIRSYEARFGSVDTAPDTRDTRSVKFYRSFVERDYATCMTILDTPVPTPRRARYMERINTVRSTYLHALLLLRMDRREEAKPLFEQVRQQAGGLYIAHLADAYLAAMDEPVPTLPAEVTAFLRRETPPTLSRTSQMRLVRRKRLVIVACLVLLLGAAFLVWNSVTGEEQRMRNAVDDLGEQSRLLCYFEVAQTGEDIGTFCLVSHREGSAPAIYAYNKQARGSAALTPCLDSAPIETTLGGEDFFYYDGWNIHFTFVSGADPAGTSFILYRDGTRTVYTILITDIVLSDSVTNPA